MFATVAPTLESGFRTPGCAAAKPSRPEETAETINLSSGEMPIEARRTRTTRLGRRVITTLALATSSSSSLSLIALRTEDTEDKALDEAEEESEN